MKLQIGVVLRAHGVRGLLRIATDSDAVAALDHLLIGERRWEVVRMTRDKADFLVELVGVTDREAADALRGQPVWALRAELSPPEAGEHYVADLVGCRVYDLGGALLGEVSGTFPGGAYELLEVRGIHEFLLPFTAPIVTEVDVAGRRIVCDPPEGLVNLDEAD